MNNQYLFNVSYYDGIYDNKSDEVITNANIKLQNYKLNTDGVPVLKNVSNRQSFHMKTVYPGLLIGTGNPHESGDSSEEIKLGFNLDYVTGLPFIPGSTVKGVLRSVFKEPDPKIKGESDADYSIRKEAYINRLNYIRDLLSNICGINIADGALSDSSLKKLETEIFGDGENGKGDTFFDAYPVKGGAGGKLFAFDSITHHEDIFKDPIPIKLLKVIPDVVFEFNYILNDSKLISELTAQKKNDFFKAIISDFGMGAKTNVGFGVMEEFNGDIKESDVISVNPVYKEKPKNVEIKEGDIVRGTVDNIKPYGAFIKLPGGKKGMLHIGEIANSFIKDINEHLSVGQTVNVRVKAIKDEGKKIDLSMKGITQ